MAYAMRADVYRLKGDYDRALTDASQALKINPKLWRAYQVRGRAYEEQKRYAEAVREFDQGDSNAAELSAGLSRAL